MKKHLKNLPSAKPPKKKVRKAWKRWAKEHNAEYIPGPRLLALFAEAGLPVMPPEPTPDGWAEVEAGDELPPHVEAEEEAIAAKLTPDWRDILRYHIETGRPTAVIWATLQAHAAHHLPDADELPPPGTPEWYATLDDALRGDSLWDGTSMVPVPAPEPAPAPAARYAPKFRAWMDEYLAHVDATDPLPDDDARLDELGRRICALLSEMRKIGYDEVVKFLGAELMGFQDEGRDA
jgi:hypothetical protein